jgi:hypothetical protein
LPDFHDVVKIVKAAHSRGERTLRATDRLEQVETGIKVALVKQPCAVKPELLNIGGQAFDLGPARCDPARRLTMPRDQGPNIRRRVRASMKYPRQDRHYLPPGAGA